MCAWTIAVGLAKPARFFEYPYFMAGIFAVFILPQAVSLLRFPGAANPEAVSAALLMTNLCLAACLVGYCIPPNRSIARFTSVRVNLDRLFATGIVFIICGFFFNFLISRIEPDEMGSLTRWSGPATIYLFFAQLVYPGLSIALTIALKRGGGLPWLATVVAAWIPLQAILIAGRREQTALFVLTIALTLFYQRRWIPPRTAVFAALAFALLAIPATGTYRTAMAEQNFEAVREIDLIGNFNKFLNLESILELRNAAMIMDATASTSGYEFGGGYWDELVFRFVPAQLLGTDFKEGLMFRPSEDRLEEEMEMRGFQMAGGSTKTGIGDSFQQFGYLGFAFFLLLAVLFRTLWLTSIQPSAVFAQLLYIQTSTSAMRAVTHQTVGFLPSLVYSFIFIGLAVWYSRDRVTDRPR